MNLKIIYQFKEQFIKHIPTILLKENDKYYYYKKDFPAIYLHIGMI